MDAFLIRGAKPPRQKVGYQRLTGLMPGNHHLRNRLPAQLFC